jgi:demethylmenaquinone methyltransferase/2-methoxy-6-polyprenyl-1,4-benzoquinol methylase
MPEARAVQAMFARIARRYDFLNRVLSAGIDRRWRARLVRRLAPLAGRDVLDVACGTGDLAFELAGAGARVVGLVFTREMLVLARTKDRAGRVPFLNGDALALPFERASFDAATIAFGLRNLEDRRRGLAELARVVRPGGTVMVLEFSLPRARLLAGPYRFYFTRVLPRVGALVSGDDEAYRYLPDTVLAWPKPEELRQEMESVGLVRTGFELLSGGIACLSFGEVASTATR